MIYEGQEYLASESEKGRTMSSAIVRTLDVRESFHLRGPRASRIYRYTMLEPEIERAHLIYEDQKILVHWNMRPSARGGLATRHLPAEQYDSVSDKTRIVVTTQNQVSCHIRK